MMPNINKKIANGIAHCEWVPRIFPHSVNVKVAETAGETPVDTSFAFAKIVSMAIEIVFGTMGKCPS